MILLAKGDQAGALASFAAALDIAPRDPETLAWAAFTSLNLSQFEGAERYARRLTEIAPKNHQGFYLLASALRALDRIPEGLAAIDKALALNPKDTESIVAKARLLKAWRMPGLAIDLYRQALAIRPSAPAAIDLAKILIKESHPEAALDVLKSVEAAIPPDLRPHAVAAEALTLLHRYDEAEPKWSAALKQGQAVSVSQTRARAEIAAGRFEVAEEILGDLIAKGQDAPTSFQILSTSRKMKADDLPLIDRMNALRDDTGLSPSQRIELNYALGKSFDDLKEYERAMGRFDEANRICRESYPHRREFDRERARAFTDFLIDYFTESKIKALAANGLSSSLPLFVVGMMRSGTTLTESVLSAHSQVADGGEQAFWTERGIEFMYNDREVFRYDHRQAMQTGQEYLKFVDPKRDGIRYVVDKNPANIDLAAIIHAVLPNAKIVHLNRHPVDNLLSLWMTPMSPNVGYLSDRENLVFAYREYTRLWKHWQNVLPSDRFATYRYEDLTSAPEETIASMLSFLDLEPEPACFAPEKNTRSVLTPSVHQVRQPIHRGSQARWKNYESWLGPFAEVLE